MKKRLFSIFLALTMALSLIPTMAMAEETAPQEGVVAAGQTDETATESQGTTPTAPTTLQAQISAAGTTSTEITLDQSYTETITINDGQNITINLNGYDIAASTNCTIINHGTLTVTGTGNVTTDKHNSAAIANFPDATATLMGGTYKSQNWYVIKNMGTMLIDGPVTIGTDNQTNPSSLIDNGWVNSSDTVAGTSVPAQNGKASLKIQSGNFKGSSGPKSCSVVKNDDYGKLEIYGGTFDSRNNTGTENATTIMNWNDLTIYGGNFYGAYPLSNGGYNNVADQGLATICGGNFTGSSSILGQNGGALSGSGMLKITGGNFTAPAFANMVMTYAIEISGGTFSSNPQQYLATGYTVSGEGPFVVVPARGMSADTEVNESTGSSSATVGGTFTGAEKPESGDNGGTVDSTQTSVTINVQTGTATDGKPSANTAVSSTTVTVDHESVKSVADAGASVTLETDVATLDIPSAAWKDMNKAAGNTDVIISVEETTSGDSTVTGWNVTATAGGNNVFEASSSPIKVSVTYSSDSAKVIVYCTDAGKQGAMKTVWDNTKDILSWETPHFSNFVPVAVTEGAEAAWIKADGTIGSGTLAQALGAVKENGGTINLLSDATLNPAQYVISGDVTITGSGKIFCTVAAGETTRAFVIEKGGSLTLDGVQLDIQGTKNTDTSKGNDGTGIDVQFGGSLILKNNAVLKLHDLERATISSKPKTSEAENPGQFIIDNSTLTITNIDGNASNGGDFSIKNKAQVDIGNCGEHGLSANKVTVDNSTVKVDKVDKAGVVAKDVALQNNGTLSVTNSGSKLPVESKYAPNGTKFEQAVELKNGGSLTIDQNSQLTMSGNVDQNNNPVNNVAANESTVENKGTIIGSVIATAPEGSIVVTFMDGSNTVAVKQISKDGKINPLPTVGNRTNYTFLGWFDGSKQITTSTTFAANTTVYAKWAYNDPSTGGSSSGGSSSSDGDYTVSVDTGKHGTVTVSPKRADKGDTVTITVKPDKGYELDELTVTDKNGDAVKLKDKGNGKFSFTMPGSKVTVEAKFVKERAAALPFADVSADHWAYDEIAWAYENGYMNGTAAAAFNPGGSVSRQQLWMILARLSGASPATMAEAREWAIGNGVSDGSNPGGAISRQQMVAILYRYAKLMGYDTTGAADLTAFPDHASVADYAKDAMAWSVKNEIVGGTAQGTLNPAGTASRAQFAVILYRFVK